MSPVEIAAIFLGAACTSFLFGVKIIRYGLIGFRDGTYPLTSEKNLTGRWARLAASVIIFFGLIACTCGIVTLVFGYFRMRQLLR